MHSQNLYIQNTIHFLAKLIAFFLIFHPFTAQADDENGRATANSLTTAYQSQVSHCAEYAALWCSGILVKTANTIDSLASEPAIYLREDLASNPFRTAGSTTIGLAFRLPGPQGPHLQTNTPYCALPFPARDTSRTAHGCWPADGNSHAHDTDPSSCNTLLSGQVSLDDWKRRFQSVTQDCSFSIQSASDFRVAMQAQNTQLLSQAMQIQMPELDIRSILDFPDPAIVYAAKSAPGRKSSQIVRELIRREIGEELPIIYFDPENQSFVYDPSDNRVDISEGMLPDTANRALASGRLYASDLQIANASRDFASSTTHLPADGQVKIRSLNTESKFQKHAYGLLYLNETPRSAADAAAIFYEADSLSARDHALYIRAALFERITRIRDVPILSLKVQGDGSASQGAFQAAPNIPLLPASLASELVNNLDARLHSTATKCQNGHVAIACSGLLVRTVQPYLGNELYPILPWGYPPSAKDRGGISFSYLRADDHADRHSTYHEQGFIATPAGSIAPNQVPFLPYCIFPYDAATISNWDPPHGQCWAARPNAVPTGLTETSDWSSCRALFEEAGKSTPKSVEEWVSTWTLDFIETRHRDVRSQCSLSVADSDQFEAAILLSQTRAKYPGTLDWNEVMVRPWDYSHWENGNIPIDAFFYKQGDSSAKQAAINFQQLYIKRTGRYVPLVSLDNQNYRIEQIKIPVPN